MLIYDDIRFQRNNLKPKLEDLRLALDLDKGQAEIAELEKKAADPAFWNDPAESQKVLQRTKQLKDKAAHYAALNTMFEGIEMDCGSCSMSPVCDEVEDLRRLHQKKAAGKNG